MPLTAHTSRPPWRKRTCRFCTSSRSDPAEYSGRSGPGRADPGRAGPRRPGPLSMSGPVAGSGPMTARSPGEVAGRFLLIGRSPHPPARPQPVAAAIERHPGDKQEGARDENEFRRRRQRPLAERDHVSPAWGGLGDAQAEEAERTLEDDGNADAEEGERDELRDDIRRDMT